jgi:hypothetical protein
MSPEMRRAKLAKLCDIEGFDDENELSDRHHDIPPLIALPVPHLFVWSPSSTSYGFTPAVASICAVSSSVWPQVHSIWRRSLGPRSSSRAAYSGTMVSTRSENR